MYIVIRRWTNAGALADTVLQHQQEIGELLRGVSGFVAYYAARDGDAVTTVTICDDRAGTQETTRLAGEWVRQNLTGAAIGAPEVTEGEVFLQF